MARFETFDQDIRLVTKDIEPEAISGELAKLARASLAEAIASGAGSPLYEKFVNGRAGAEEEAVVAPGPIDYEFSWWPEVIDFAIEYLQRRSPHRSGRFMSSWFVIVDNTRIADWSDIPIGATVYIANDLPYARKVEVGHMQMSVPHGVAEAGRLAVRRFYGQLIDVRRRMIDLPGGYVLKGVFRRGYRPDARRVLRPDVTAGQRVSYPALVMMMRL